MKCRISGRMSNASISRGWRITLRGVANGHEPSRVADTYEGRSCLPSAPGPELEVAMRAGPPAGGPDALGLVGFARRRGLPARRKRSVRADRAPLHPEHPAGMGPAHAGP